MLKEMGTPPLRSNMFTPQLALSTAVRNRVTKTQNRDTKTRNSHKDTEHGTVTKTRNTEQSQRHGTESQGHGTESQRSAFGDQLCGKTETSDRPFQCQLSPGGDVFSA